MDDKTLRTTVTAQKILVILKVIYCIRYLLALGFFFFFNLKLYLLQAITFIIVIIPGIFIRI